MADAPRSDTAREDENDSSARHASPARPISPIKIAAPSESKMICERCGAAEMYRMHAVWRCPACGFKTDCCGW
jgi:ribosomal protein L37AE/L43A